MRAEAASSAMLHIQHSNSMSAEVMQANIANLQSQTPLRSNGFEIMAENAGINDMRGQALRSSLPETIADSPFVAASGSETMPPINNPMLINESVLSSVQHQKSQHVDTPESSAVRD